MSTQVDDKAPTLPLSEPRPKFRRMTESYTRLLPPQELLFTDPHTWAISPMAGVAMTLGILAQAAAKRVMSSAQRRTTRR